jgi:hypothetical protein
MLFCREVQKRYILISHFKILHTKKRTYYPLSEVVRITVARTISPYATAYERYYSMSFETSHISESKNMRFTLLYIYLIINYLSLFIHIIFWSFQIWYKSSVFILNDAQKKFFAHHFFVSE